MTQNIDKDYECFFFLIEVPLIEIKWIWLKSNAHFMTYAWGSISAFFWAVLRQNVLHDAPNTLLLQKIR